MLSPTVLAKQAYEFGLVNHVSTAATLESDTADFVKRLCNGPSMAYAAIKSNLSFLSSGDFDGLIEHEARSQAMCATGYYHRNAVEAYLRKN
jgi:2-(1,2-epoxy-1,2-dihydrophenyl)acetyl-CoA isomerase